MKLTIEQLRSISETLQCGEICFIHKFDGKLESYPIDIDDYMDDENPWEETIEKVDNNREDYIELRPMESRDSYKVMEAYAESFSSENLQQELFKALYNSKPFGRFKHIIDNSGAFRQKWFDFKNDHYIQWVRQCIEMMEEE